MHSAWLGPLVIGSQPPDHVRGLRVLLIVVRSSLQRADVPDLRGHLADLAYPLRDDVNRFEVRLSLLVEEQVIIMEPGPARC